MPSQQSFRDAYQYLRANEGKVVGAWEIADATHGAWSANTAKNYQSKKLKNLLKRVAPGLFEVSGVSLLSEAEFIGTMTQVTHAIVSEQAKAVEAALHEGESDKVEFKERIPKNASELSDVIAAFATVAGGTILVGVRDDGTVVGYSESKERLEGIARSVDPVPTTTVDLVNYGRVVGLIRVAPGPSPIYLSNRRAYFRTGTESRPGTALEIVDRVRHSLRQRPRVPPALGMQSGTVEFGPNQLTAVATIRPIDLLRSDWGFSPTNDIRCEVSDDTLTFHRGSSDGPGLVSFWVRQW